MYDPRHLKELPSLFNPSNDMALAANVQEYSPPKRIQQMEKDLSSLADYWEGGPWGWSRQTKHRYERMGISDTSLPSDEWLEEVRRLSSREFAAGYLEQMLREISDNRLLGNEMKFHTQLADIPSEGDRIFKSLWSSSGRGIFTAKGLSKPHLHERLQRLIDAHGGYVSDRFYTSKTLDFAMEFFVHGANNVEFLGYSIFHADPNGTYQYNHIASQQTLRNMIPLPTSLLNTLTEYHLHNLGKTAYRGYAGIDMLLTEEGMVHPVVEINFRMNMGILAMQLYDKYGDNATVQLTPRREHGFEAKIDNGKLMILYR